MKKTLSVILIATVLAAGAVVINSYAKTDKNIQTQSAPEQQNRQAAIKLFEQRLNLTEKQKQKAAQIHKEGRTLMKPVMMQIEVKRQEIENVKLTKMTQKAQQERIDEINSEIKELEKQAQEIRKKNTQEFENLLNKKQKTELEKMKAEGRARFEREHPPRPPFGGLGTPGFLFRPLLPPPPENSPANGGFWK